MPSVCLVKMRLFQIFNSGGVRGRLRVSNGQSTPISPGCDYMYFTYFECYFPIILKYSSCPCLQGFIQYS